MTLLQHIFKAKVIYYFIVSKMKTANGELWTSAAKKQPSNQNRVVAVPTINQSKPHSIDRNDAKKSKSKLLPPPRKMRSTQVLVSRNEGNTLSSWLRDIVTVSIPLYVLYLLATHPLIKNIGKPNYQKLYRLEQNEKFIHEYNQHLKFLRSVKEYNFFMTMHGDQCYEFPNSEIVPYVPKRGAIFQNRYKKWLPKKKQKGDSKYKKLQSEKKKPVKVVKGVMVNARKKMMPHL